MSFRTAQHGEHFLLQSTQNPDFQGRDEYGPASASQMWPPSLAGSAGELDISTDDSQQLINQSNNTYSYSYGYSQPHREENYQMLYPLEPITDVTSPVQPGTYYDMTPRLKEKDQRMADEFMNTPAQNGFANYTDLRSSQQSNLSFTTDSTQYTNYLLASSNFPLTVPPRFVGLHPSFHATYPEHPTDSQRTKFYPCLRCDKTFKRKGDMERHARGHGPPTHFCEFPSCKFHTKGFSRKDKLADHMKVHTRHDS